MYVWVSNRWLLLFFFFLDHIDIVEYLIQHGCDVNKTDINNVSALHIACQKGNYDAVRLLLNGDFKKIIL